MCTVCGCGHSDSPHRPSPAGYRRLGQPRSPVPRLDFGASHSGVHVPGLAEERIVAIETDVMARNQAHADRNRARLAAAGVFALNLVSSPGAGKTRLLVATLEALRGRCPLAVIEGDQQTRLDADRIAATGVPTLQINTGKGCHLDAAMIEMALTRLPPPAGGVLFIENVGNLVCPAGFDLGEAHKVVLLSVTEGEDKPLKYPDMFAAADLMLINKIDLTPYVDFDRERCVEYARRIKPSLRVLYTSAATGEGLDDWLDWLTARLAKPAPPREEWKK